MKPINYCCLFAVLLCLVRPLSAQITINEYSASNHKTFRDNYQEYEDWLELYNTASDNLDISGWWLSDKTNNPQKWAIPAGTIIPGNGFIRIWCSGRNLNTSGANMHTSFKLTQTKGNESLVLSQPNGNIVESFPLQITLTGHSMARDTDGGSEWKICTTPSPRTSNNLFPKFTAYSLPPMMSLAAGFYAGTQSVSISSSDPDAVIRYTLNGTAPVETSPIYSDPIVLTTTTVVKARNFSSDTTLLPGKIEFNTYFIDEDFSLAVISVAADSILELANGDKPIRPIGSLEYFSPTKQRTATSYGELNSHGQDSWINPQRSIDWISRDEMGYSASIKEKLFSYSDRDEFQRVILRASGDDNYPSAGTPDHDGSTHIRDEYVHTLALEGGMDLDVRASERILVFLNGQYWGVYGLRERPVDHDYTDAYYKQGKYDLHFLNTWGDTWAEYGGIAAFDDWAEIRNFILNNDMSDSARYEIVKDKIRLTSLIDYMIANLNSVASDWLNYNTGWWRGTHPDGDHKKWGYILWDNDATFDFYINYSGVPNTQPTAKPCDIEAISNFMDQFFSGHPDVGKHEKIFLKLQRENEEFRQLYYSRQADLMNTVYTCDNMLQTLDRMVAVIAPEMPRHIARWGGSMSEWEQNILRLRSFIEKRCTLLDDGMVNCFNLDGPYELTLMVEPSDIAGIGQIDLNTINNIETFPWTGRYFGGMDNLIKAKALDNDYEFIRWESKTGSTIISPVYNRKSTIRLTQPDTLIAHFGIPTATYETATGFGFSAYPTIAREQLTLKYDLEEASNVQVSLQSVLGHTVWHFPEVSGRVAAGSHQEVLDLQQAKLAPGLYLLTVRNGTRSGVVKVTILGD